MPFSFKLETPQKQGDSPSGLPQVSFGSASSQNLMARRYEDGRSLIQLGLMVIFGLVCFSIVVLAAYKFYLTSQIEKKRAILNEKEQQLTGYPIEEMDKLSARVKSIDRLVREHPSANAALRILEESIEHSIIYRNFTLTFDQGKTYTFKVDAFAPSYRALAQQADTYNAKPYSDYLSNVKIEGLTLTEGGAVNFSVTGNIKIQGLFAEDLIFTEPVEVVASSEVSVENAATSSMPIAPTAPVGPTSPSTP